MPADQRQSSATLVEVKRRFPVGAELQPGGGTHFRVWAPDRKSVDVLLFDESGKDGEAFPLEREERGYFAGFVEAARAGTLYKVRLDGGDAFPDPASRFQPQGPHGPSQVVDSTAFQWSDHGWRGAELKGQVIYELHLGTFTAEGTYAAAAKKLPLLKEVGITCVELMPLAEFPGEFGWGYDGVDMFAPCHLYGSPDELRAFINEAHGIGMAVILDVVYNHLGPSGNYLRQFAKDYFTDKHKTEWGDALNFDGENCHGLREFFLSNVEYWLTDFHFDGLRLDATQAIIDTSKKHFLKELAERVQKCCDHPATPTPGASGTPIGERKAFVVAENEPQETRVMKPWERGGYGLDGLWNDDLHHASIVALTGRKEAYYSDYNGSPQEFVSGAKYGTLYQGQRYTWQQQRRGHPSFGIAPHKFVTFLENHDQVANSGRGTRLHRLTSPGRLKAMTAYLLLSPGTPMLFQGQEFGSTKPFLYFADHEPELAKAVSSGRKEFLAQFPSLASKKMRNRLDDPSARSTFERCVLDWRERESDYGKQMLALHRDLIALRRRERAFAGAKFDGAVLGPHAFLLRFFDEQQGDRMLVVNLGVDLHLFHAPEPLLAPPDGKVWDVIWSSEDPKYGGCGTAHPDTESNWIFPGEAALVLGPVAANPEHEPGSGD